MILRILKKFIERMEEKEKLIEKKEILDEEHKEIVTKNSIYLGFKGKR